MADTFVEELLSQYEEEGFLTNAGNGEATNDGNTVQLELDPEDDNYLVVYKGSTEVSAIDRFSETFAEDLYDVLSTELNF